MPHSLIVMAYMPGTAVVAVISTQSTDAAQRSLGDADGRRRHIDTGAPVCRCTPVLSFPAKS